MLPNYDNGITPHVNEYVHTRPLCKYLKSDYAHTSVIGGVYGGGVIFLPCVFPLLTHRQLTRPEGITEQPHARMMLFCVQFLAGYDKNQKVS